MPKTSEDTLLTFIQDATYLQSLISTASYILQNGSSYRLKREIAVRDIPSFRNEYRELVLRSKPYREIDREQTNGRLKDDLQRMKAEIASLTLISRGYTKIKGIETNQK